MALMFNLSVIMRNDTAYSLLQMDVSICHLFFSMVERSLQRMYHRHALCLTLLTFCLSHYDSPSFIRNSWTLSVLAVDSCPGHQWADFIITSSRIEAGCTP